MDLTLTKAALYACLIILCHSINGTSANYYWKGSLGNTSWSSSTNWATTSGGLGGAGAPGSSDTAIFDLGSMMNCSLSGNIAVASFQMKNSYIGTITLGSGNSLSVSSYATMSGGTFNGSSGSLIVKDLSLNGATFAAPANTTISGDLSLSGTVFSPVTGTVKFNSASDQYIILSRMLGTPEFYNLTVEKSSGELNMGGNINVKNTLTMTKGNIAMEGNILQLGSSFNSGTLNHSEGFLTGSGTFRRYIPAAAISMGSSKGMFPLGYGNFDRSVWLGAVGGVISSAGYISVTHLADTGYITMSSFTDGGISVTRRQNSSWRITTSGLGLGTGSGGEELELRIKAEQLPGVVDYSALRLVRATDAIGNYVATTGSNSLPVANRSGNSLPGNTFYMGSNNINPLPVTLAHFRATPSEIGIVLSWETLTELNNAHFEIQRSADGRSFEKVGVVKGQGTTFSSKQYEFIDDTEQRGGVVYYRLKQADVNGKTDLSHTIALHNKYQEGSLRIFPNPIKRTQKLNIGTYPQAVHIFDIAGSLRLSKEDLKQPLDISALEPGSYVTVIYSPKGAHQVTKLIIE